MHPVSQAHLLCDDDDDHDDDQANIFNLQNNIEQKKISFTLLLLIPTDAN